MKKLSFLLLASLIVCPAFAEDYDDEYDDTYEEETYSAPAATTYEHGRDTYTGIRIHRNGHIRAYFEPHHTKSSTVLDNNFGLGLNIGNRLTDNVKLEFETAYTGLAETKHGRDFNYDIWSNMLNVYFYKTYGMAVEPYFGLGIGLSGLWADIEKTPEHTTDGDADLSLSIMAGVNFALNKYVDLNLGLKYINYGDIKHKHAFSRIDAAEIYIGAAYKFSIFK